jgi:hypothetical protein
LSETGRGRAQTGRRTSKETKKAKKVKKTPKKGTGATATHESLINSPIEEELRHERDKSSLLRLLRDDLEVAEEPMAKRIAKARRMALGDARAERQGEEMKAWLDQLDKNEDWGAVSALIQADDEGATALAKAEWMVGRVAACESETREAAALGAAGDAKLARWLIFWERFGYTHWVHAFGEAEQSQCLARGARMAHEAALAIEPREPGLAARWSSAGMNWARTMCWRYPSPERAENAAQAVRAHGEEPRWIENLGKWIEEDIDSAPILRALGIISPEQEKRDLRRFVEADGLSQDEHFEEVGRRAKNWGKKRARKAFMRVFENAEESESSALTLAKRERTLDLFDAARPGWMRPKDAAAIFALVLAIPFGLSSEMDEGLETKESQLGRIAQFEASLERRSGAPLLWGAPAIRSASTLVRRGETAQEEHAPRWSFNAPAALITLAQAAWLTDPSPLADLARIRGVAMSLQEATRLRALLNGARCSDSGTRSRALTAIGAECARLEAAELRAGAAETGAGAAPASVARRSRI